MADGSLPGTDRPLVSRVKIDLRDEAHRFFRQRLRVVAVGVVLGLVFMGVGVFEVGVLYSRGLSVDYAIALLLIILGAGVAFVSLYMGLINPVTLLEGNASGITFDRRWGGPRSWSWREPGFRLDIDDRSIDPTAGEEARDRLFFEGPGAVYGNLSRASVGPLLDVARTYGAVVSMKQLEQSERGQIRLVRRIRIRPSPIR